MLIKAPLLEDVFGVSPRNILHLGAHLGEESVAYSKMGWDEVTWIEANPNLIDGLKASVPFGQRVVQAAIHEVGGIPLQLNLANASQSSSLLEFGAHAVHYPEISFVETITVITRRVDEIFTDSFNFDFLNLDIQGSELSALKSMGVKINSLKWIYVEVNRKELYVGCPHVSEIDSYLASFGFRRKATKWYRGGPWGDALYVKGQLNLSLFKKIKYVYNFPILDFLLWLPYRGLALRRATKNIFRKFKGRD
jgi:FkbM family methyltransferase